MKLLVLKSAASILHICGATVFHHFVICLTILKFIDCVLLQHVLSRCRKHRQQSNHYETENELHGDAFVFIMHAVVWIIVDSKKENVANVKV